MSNEPVDPNEEELPVDPNEEKPSGEEDGGEGSEYQEQGGDDYGDPVHPDPIKP